MVTTYFVKMYFVSRRR